MSVCHLHLKSKFSTIPHFIEEDIWTILIKNLSELFGLCSIFVICDSNILQLYGNLIESKLKVSSGFQGIISFPAGESSKSREQKNRIEDLLLEKKAGRDTVLVALGGGVTGDLAGFVASSLHRGIPLIHVPTSLLAMVDSSIGGKVGINHKVGKNLLGAFYQPKAVFIDPLFLNTLPEIEFRSGLAEVIKYAFILDDQLWEWLETETKEIKNRHLGVLKKIIERSVSLKIAVVEKDETESLYRSILNFGHTLGHAVEKLGEYKIKHGLAVAVGMLVAARLSEKILNYPVERVERFIKVLKDYRLLDVDISQYSLDSLWEVMTTDKKARQQMPRFTLMKRPGIPSLYHPISKEELGNVL